MAKADKNDAPGSGFSRRGFVVVTAVGSLGTMTALDWASGADAAPRGAASTTPFIAATVRKMSLEAKVGQLFVFAVAGTSADTTEPGAVEKNQKLYGFPNADQIVRAYQPGGIVYFRGDWNNLDSPGQVAALSNGLQRAASMQRPAIPLLICTDQEQGGYVVRAPGTLLPGSMGLAASPERESDALKAAQITRAELKAMGINQNFAPVADVASNPANPIIHVRSFGDDPDIVSTLVTTQVVTFQAPNGVVSAVKHFPGHGDTDTDSHTGLPIITRNREQFDQIDLPPFEAAIRAGVGAIMTAHIVVPALDDSGAPATLSKPILTGLLREKLGFDGVVITDALDMAGVRQQHTDAEIPVLALKAGVDQLLMPPEPKVAYDAVLRAVRSGELSERRINESVARVLALKKRFGLFRDACVDEAAVASVVGSADHQATAAEITDRTITLLKNDADVLPLAADAAQRVLVTGWGETTTRNLANVLITRNVATTRHPTGDASDPEAVRVALALAKDNDVTIVVTRGLGDAENIGQRELVAALVRTGKPVIAVAILEPYDIAYMPEVSTHLATYSYAVNALESLARVIYGDVKPSGRLPVDIPSSTEPGTVLYSRGHHVDYR